MEREVGAFGIADFFAGQRRKRPNFIDMVNDMVQWKPVEKIPHKKLKRNAINAVGVKAYPALIMFVGLAVCPDQGRETGPVATPAQEMDTLSHPLEDMAWRPGHMQWIRSVSP